LARPSSTSTIRAFYVKIFFLILANLNAVYFEALYRRQVEAKQLDAGGPSTLKVIAVVRSSPGSS
jgi:hypothetical protein